MNDNTEVINREKSCLNKAVKVIAVILAVYAAIACIKKLVCVLFKRKEAANEEKEIKEYYSYFDNREIKLPTDSFTGVIVKEVMSAISLDLSDAIIEKDSFISVDCLMSALSIVLPKNVNVKVDGIIKGSAINNDVPEYDETVPTLYIALKAYGSAVNIKNTI